ncbi:MAG: hypothetical protein HRF43_00130 [Phycisphaerae bacterium]
MRRKKPLPFLVLVTFAAGHVRAGLYESNLLGNPSFEDYYTGSAANWTSGASAQYDLQTDNALARGVQAWLNAGADNASIRSDGPGTGHTGHYYGTGGNSNLPAGHLSRMRQDVDLAAVGFTAQELDGAVLALDAGAWLSSSPSDADSVEVRIYCLDAGKSVLAPVFATGLRNHDVWTLYQTGPLPLPAGTRFIRFDVEFVKQAGNNSDGRIDDAWLRLVPLADPPGPMLDRNLVANPGFEAGSGGWRALLGNPRARLTNIDGVPARSGQYFLFGGQRPMSPTLNQALAVQEITLAAYGFRPELLADPDAVFFLQLEGWLSSFGNVGNIRLRLDLRDEQGASLIQYDSGRVRSDKRPAPFRWQTRLPPEARQMVLTLDMLDPAGTNLDGYADDLSVLVTKVPHRPRLAGPFAAAHRGNSIIAPENTLAAFTAARGLARFGELDTYVCASGEIVVMHDNTVDRTTAGTGPISGLTLAQLKQLEAGSWFSPDFAGEPIPTLEEALAALLPEVTPLIERKAGSAASLLAELQRLGVSYQVVVQSFDWNFLAELHSLDPNVALGALFDGALTAARVDQARAAGAGFIALSQANVNAQSLALTHGAGLQLVVWTVNDAGAMQQFIDLGVDGIITDHPAAVRWLVDPSLSPADLDADGDVDAIDLLLFRACHGPAGVPVGEPACAPADLDLDGDADQGDFGLLQRCLGRPDATPPPGCAQPAP